MNPIREEFDLGEQKKEFKGKTIKIKKIVKKETGSFTLKDTYIAADETLNNSRNGPEVYNYSHSGDLNIQQMLPPDGNIEEIPLVESQEHFNPAENYDFSKRENTSPGNTNQREPNRQQKQVGKTVRE